MRQMQWILGLCALMLFCTSTSCGARDADDKNPQPKKKAETPSKQAALDNRIASIRQKIRDTQGKVVLEDEEWKLILSDMSYYVTRQQGTERAFTGKYDKFYQEGTYHCACCGAPLFSSKAKYDSGTGWPSFYEPVSSEALAEHDDFKLRAKRTEVVCQRCDAHLGHVFDDGPRPTGLRYCINSVALTFKSATQSDKEKK